MGINYSFSILIPAYKDEFLYACLESVMSQNYHNFEVIVVDDCSPSDLGVIVKQFKDDRIKFFRNEKNCGAKNVVDNWNICLSHATGDFIICMGDDDMLSANCLEEYNNVIQKYPELNVYHAWTKIIDEFGRVIGMQEPRPEYEGLYSIMYNRWHNGRYQYIGDWAFRKDFLKKIGGFLKLPFAWGSDDLTVFIGAEKLGVANIQKPVFNYRVNSNTISNNGYYLEKLLSTEKLIRIVKKRFLNKKPVSLSIAEDIYYGLCQKEIVLFELATQNVDVAGDIRQRGKIRSLLWWIFNHKKYDITINRFLKIWLKQINK